jgi:hypothetical protein
VDKTNTSFIKGTMATSIDAIPLEKRCVQRHRTREGRLVVLVLVIVVAYIITKFWSDVVDTFNTKVLKIGPDRLVAKIVVAIFFTVILLWLLLYFGMDDQFSNTG